MAIRRRSLRNARNLKGLRSSRFRRYGGAGSNKSSSGKKTTKVKPNKKPIRAFSQNSPPSRPPPSRPRSNSSTTSRKPVVARAHAVGHYDYLKVIQREYSALANLVQKHINDSEHLKTEFNKLKSNSVYLK